MNEYTVYFTDGDAVHPAPVQTQTVITYPDVIWDIAASLGLVNRIDIKNSGTTYTAFSKNWEHNFIGVTEEQIWDNING